MNNKDSITFDDIAIDLGDHGADSTMVDTLDTITLGSSIGTITFPSSAFQYAYSGISTINNISSNSQWTTGTGGYTIGNPTPSTVSITNTGIDMAAGTDITVDGQSLKQFMNKMEQRLAILVPDPKKLEQFAALQKAYEHYKTMESLCFDEPEEEPKQ